MKSTLSMAAIATALLAGCASTPDSDDSFQRLATRGCAEVGREMIVTGRVSRADDENLVMWDGHNMNRSVSVRLPRQSTVDRIRGALGTSPHERAVRQLNELATQNAPVTATLVCQGSGASPNVLRLSYVDSGGVRNDITFK